MDWFLYDNGLSHERANQRRIKDSIKHLYRSFLSFYLFKKVPSFFRNDSVATARVLSHRFNISQK